MSVLVNGRRYDLVEIVAIRRQMEMMESVPKTPVAEEATPGTCSCGCGRALRLPGSTGRPNKTGLSGYCAAMKRYWKRQGRFRLVGA